MNREIKRRMKRERESADRLTRTRQPMQARRERVKVRQYFREIQSELRRVIWPTRNEVVTYSIVVVVVVSILTGVVFALDLGFAKAAFMLFSPKGTGP